MQDLEITWPDGIARFSPEDSPVQIGRSSQAAVPLTEGSVSRRHLELAWTGASWTVSDGSTHGTYDTHGVKLSPAWNLSDDVSMRLGGVKGVLVEVRTITTPRPHSNGADAGAASSGTALADNTALADDIGLADNTALADNTGRADNNDVGNRAPAEQDNGFASNFDRNVGSAGPSLFTESGLPGDARFDAPAEAAPSPGAPPPLFGGEPLVPDPILAESGFTAPPLERAPERPRPAILDELRADGSLPPPKSISEAPSVSAAPPAPAPDLDRRAGEPPMERLDAPQPKDDANMPGATGGYPAVRLGPNSTVISDSAIRLSIDGQDYSFLPGAEISVGRDPNSLVKVDEKHSLVSRRHLNLTFDNGAWWISDTSSKGTFIDNKRLTGRYKAEGAFVANLGDDDAGTPMKVITAGEHRTPRQFNLFAVAALASIALIPLILLAFLLSRESAPSSEPDFVTAKQATVMLFGLDGGQGSGFFVADNLIVTNQHVAVLSPQMLVGVSRQTDEPAQIEYATELVANHPYLDIAVLRISNRAVMSNDGPQISSEPVGEINLPSVPIGDSNDITIGDEVFSTGFPDRLSITSQDDAGELRLPPVAATSGEAASFTIWPGCSNPDFSAFIPATSPPGVACAAEGDVNKGVLRSTFSSGQGASGSAVFRNNEVVAVVYAGDADDLNTSLNITSAAFQPWLQEIIDANS